MIYRNNKEVKALYRGDKEVLAVYRGNALVWQKPTFNSVIRGFVNDDFYGGGIVYCWRNSDDSDGSEFQEIMPDDQGYFETYLDTAHEYVSFVDMFGDCDGITSLDLSGLDTSNVCDMYRMFAQLDSIEELDLSNFDTSKVTNMHFMFGGCPSLKNINLSSFDTSNVKDMSYMFYACGFTDVDLSSFDTSNVTSMEGMFCWEENLVSLDLSSFDTSNVTTMIGMFNSDFNLISLDLSSFDTSNVTPMDGMFLDCYCLEELDISNFDFSNASVENMFQNCKSLKHLRFGKNLKESLDLSDCPLDYESVVSVVDGLAEVSSTKILNFSLITQMTALDSHEHYKALQKGWSVPIGGSNN